MFEINFESPQPMEMQFFNGGGGAVKSVNGQTGDVVLNAGDIGFNDSTTYSSGSVGAEVSDLKSAVENLDGISPALKAALLQLATKVAYIDANGQDYYDDLYDALYPPANLVSISAVYTQSGTVFNTDSLDDLKSDLVVTATYDDSSTATVTTYTLSGTLTVGTSTITVMFEGKTTTFNVTVTERSALYPLENGTHTFTSNNRVLTVTNGNHIRYEAPNAIGGATGAYLNLSEVSSNDASGTSNFNDTRDWFTVPSGASYIYRIKNITHTYAGSGANLSYSCSFRQGTTNTDIKATALTTFDDVEVTGTASAAIPCSYLFMYCSSNMKTIEFDVELYVNGARWV